MRNATWASSAVVGSSAIRQVRVAGQRKCDQHPLPLAARQLVRVLAQPPFRIGDAGLLEKLDAHGPAPLSVSSRGAVSAARPPCRRRGRAGSARTWAPERSSPCAERAGGAILPPARATRRDRPPGSRPKACNPSGTIPIMENASSDLPDPDSPTTPIRCPGRTVRMTSRRIGPAGASMDSPSTSYTGAGVMPAAPAQVSDR